MTFDMPRIRFSILREFTEGSATTEKNSEETAIKRTYQPKKRYRRNVHGFMKRMSTVGGARVIQNRRRKGRARLAAS